MNARIRTITAISIGNALEWFEIAIYGFLAVPMAKLFFPVADETVSLLLAFGTFGVTFVARPIGAFVLGSHADRHGRKPALTLSIGLMVLGTAMIGCAPTYAQVGMAAPVLVIVARLIQGFAVGGEFGSATALLAEQDAGRRGFHASWQHASQGAMSVLAGSFGFGLYALLTPAAVLPWGWRVPFLFGLLIGPVGLYIRRHLDESRELKADASGRSPVRDLLGAHRGRVLACIGLYVLGTILSYTTIYMPTFAVTQLGLPVAASFLGAIVMGVLKVLLCPPFGRLADRTGCVPVIATATVVLMLCIVPGFMFLVAHPSITALLLVQAMVAVIGSAYWGPVSAAMAALFPAADRATGLSVGYSVAVAVFGGTAPFVNAWLVAQTGLRIVPSLVVVAGAILTLVALAAARRYGVR